MKLIIDGTTQGNKERRYLGKTDESLSEEGIEILGAYKMQKLYPDVEYLFTSPMKRCTETAKIIYPTLCPVIIPEWEEINFGRFEYRNYEELKDVAEYQEWLLSGGTLDFTEGESRNGFALRCKCGFIRMCNELSQTVGRNTKKPASIGMIVHGIKPKKVVIPVPSFYGYEYAAKSAGSAIIFYEMNQENNFCVKEDMNRILTEDVDLLFLANPNNPIGNLLDIEMIKKMLLHCRDKGIYVVIDECFIDFCGVIKWNILK